MSVLTHGLATKRGRKPRCLNNLICEGEGHGSLAMLLSITTDPGHSLHITSNATDVCFGGLVFLAIPLLVEIMPPPSQDASDFEIIRYLQSRPITVTHEWQPPHQLQKLLHPFPVVSGVRMHMVMIFADKTQEVASWHDLDDFFLYADQRLVRLEMRSIRERERLLLKLEDFRSPRRVFKWKDET